MAKETTPNGIEYESESAGQAGARYYLIIGKKQHTIAEINEAKKYIRENFDAVHISIEHNVCKKKNSLKK